MHTARKEPHQQSSVVIIIMGRLVKVYACSSHLSRISEEVRRPLLPYVFLVINQIKETKVQEDLTHERTKWLIRIQSLKVVIDLVPIVYEAFMLMVF